jgi:hypothetical protein
MNLNHCPLISSTPPTLANQLAIDSGANQRYYLSKENA